MALSQKRELKFHQMRAGYNNLWNKAHMTREPDLMHVANDILADRGQYEATENATGVPWFWIACVHDRESNRNFATVLHNGERNIIGTGRLTTKVPKGRGPFNSWGEAAIDALTLPEKDDGKELNKVEEWTLARCLYQFEEYNGWGYNGKINSPYVWAGTSNQQRGKYTSDGVYTATHWDTQLGCAGILKALIRVAPEIEEQLGLTIDADNPDEDATDDPQPVINLASFTIDALSNEILSRQNVAELHIIKRKEKE